jgi:hypothetical protein
MCFIGFTIPKNTFHVLAHLHEFAEHYHHHNQEAHEKPDLFNFIVDHFIAENHHDDHADEEDLPFNHEPFVNRVSESSSCARMV